ncbi:glycosyltransferase family 4 protein [Novosphingobium mangrovi (ex Huang et al. 2023)]|uniref:Glycosyltransferase family 4 protein n=1 Tax=Novosphingobium mangrovi (ex Huang et al. 2023) TaxID=2976432 RepID=A0ABT2I486_9SPHN|nr:glycosyltransferase family 4 protein [Novosphingobium mangrovi (ex Huang et al. 2023)]MCT2399626.1 glycosyltransferase family 4 protein [Novosphingobium mangrovi (ex Huang et al. 2023)]
MTRPRIAYVINSLEGGGAALPVPAIGQVLRDAGADVRVFALLRRDGRALPPMVDAGLDPVIREGSDKDHLAAARWLKREVRAWGATHVWTSLSRATILGLLVGPALGLPVIAWQHNAFLKPWNRRLMRLLQSRAALWVADSRSVADLTVERLGVAPDRLVTWPIYFADPAMPEARPWSPGEHLRLGSLGRLHPAKGYDVLIAALARLRASGFEPPVPFEIAVAGDGTQGDRLKALAAEAGVTQFRLAGYTDSPRTFLAGLHLYLQPSRAEGFCIAAHEALTAGLPVIGSRVGEMPHSITVGKTGWLVEPGEVDSLVHALREALSRPEALAEMGQAARADMFTRFSKAQFAATGAEILHRVLLQDNAAVR